MHKIDIIILSYAKTEELKALTQQTINSLLESEDSSNINFNILVIESNKLLAPFQFPSSTTIYPKEKFGFNKYLNIGIKMTNNQYICFCNNDLIFYKNWANRIFTKMRDDIELLSASPYCPVFHGSRGIKENSGLIYGYVNGINVTGWCIFINRKLLSTIGLFDEKIKFWYSDDDYRKTLEKHKIKHALVTESIVEHIGSKTLESEVISVGNRNKLTNLQWVYYDYKWNHKNCIIYMMKYVKTILKYPSLVLKD